VAEARLRAGAALHPMAYFRAQEIRKQLIKERGAQNIATGL
jgi:L-rhamnose isomerase/sugar isomerase